MAMNTASQDPKEDTNKTFGETVDEIYQKNMQILKSSYLCDEQLLNDVSKHINMDTIHRLSRASKVLWQALLPITLAKKKLVVTSIGDFLKLFESPNTTLLPQFVTKVDLKFVESMSDVIKLIKNCSPRLLELHVTEDTKVTTGSFNELCSVLPSTNIRVLHLNVNYNCYNDPVTTPVKSIQFFKANFKDCPVFSISSIFLAFKQLEVVDVYTIADLKALEMCLREHLPSFKLRKNRNFSLERRVIHVSTPIVNFDVQNNTFESRSGNSNNISSSVCTNSLDMLKSPNTSICTKTKNKDDVMSNKKRKI